MIADLNKLPTLDDVLNRIASLPTPPTSVQLREFMAAYPQFADEIVDFATDWFEMESLPEPKPASAEEVDLIVDKTMSRVRQMMFERARTQALVDLEADIKDSGHDVVSFEKALGIDGSILDCLISRLVDRKTLPKRLVVAMATALGRTIDSVRDYFRQEPVAAVAYRSKGKPSVRQESFAKIVGYSTLPESDKQRWLAEAPDDEME